MIFQNCWWETFVLKVSYWYGWNSLFKCLLPSLLIPSFTVYISVFVWFLFRFLRRPETILGYSIGDFFIYFYDYSWRYVNAVYIHLCGRYWFPGSFRGTPCNVYRCPQQQGIGNVFHTCIFLPSLVLLLTRNTGSR